jgi:hypothetical protein
MKRPTINFFICYIGRDDVVHFLRGKVHHILWQTMCVSNYTRCMVLQSRVGTCAAQIIVGL